jgi:hypothetical protein
MCAEMTDSSNVNSDRSQRFRFIETTRALERYQGEAAFKAKLAVIAWQKPEDDRHGDRRSQLGREEPDNDSR